MKLKDFNFDLRQIRSFMETARNRSFTRASRALKIGQATVSHHIASLEESLGVALMERKGRNVTLTAQGELFLDFCEGIFRDLEGVRSGMLLDRFGSVTRIAASTIPATYLLPEIISMVRKRRSDLVFSVEIRDSREAVDLIREGKAEAGIVGEMIRHPSLRYEHFLDDRILLAGGHSSPDSAGPETLCEIPFVSREFGSGTRNAWEKALSARGVRPSSLRTVYECSTSEGAREAVIAGIGVSFLSRFAVERDLAARRLKEIRLDFEIPREFYLVYSRTKRAARRVNDFIEAAREYAKGKTTRK